MPTPAFGEPHMDTVFLLGIALSLVATLFGLLILILGWLGNKIYVKLDTVVSSLHSMKEEVHERINHLDRRVTRLETVIDPAQQVVSE